MVIQRNPIAFSITVIGHPICVNFLTLWLLFTIYPQMVYGIHPSVQWFYMGCIALTTGLIPLLYVTAMTLMNRKMSIMLPEKEDRNMPYIITSVMYLIDFYLSKRIGSPVLLSAYLLGCSAVVVMVLIVNLYTKISIHGASLGALLAVVISAWSVADMDLRFPVMMVIVFSGAVLSSRLFLQAHTPVQAYSGFATGFFLMLLIL